jgi:hypothetical protein
MAAYTFRRSARFAFLPVAGAPVPEAAIAGAPGALAGALAIPPVWDHAFMEVATINVATASSSSLLVFMGCSGC